VKVDARNEIVLSPDGPEDDQIQIVTEIPESVFDIYLTKSLGRYLRPNAHKETKCIDLGPIPFNVIQNLGKCQKYVRNIHADEDSIPNQCQVNKIAPAVRGR